MAETYMYIQFRVLCDEASAIADLQYNMGKLWESINGLQHKESRCKVNDEANHTDNSQH